MDLARLGRPVPRMVLASALAAFLFAGGLRAFLASIYYHNLTSLGLNATALFTLLLLAPLLYAIPRLAERPHRVALAAGAALAAARVALPFTAGTLLHLAVAGLAAASFLVLLPALLRASRGEAGDEGPVAVALGVALGWLADAATLVASGSFDRTGTPPGLLLVAPVGVGLVLALLAGRPVDAWPKGRDPLPGRARTALAGVGVGAFLFLEHAVLGAPHAVARWGPHPLALAALGTLGGLAAGAFLLARPPARWGPLVVALNVGGLLALLDHGFLHTPLAPLLIALTHAALVVDLALAASLLSRATLRRAGVALLWGALALVLLHFVLAFTFTFAYVPLGELWKGQERVLPALAFLLVAAGAAADGAEAWKGIRPRALPRRALLAAGLALLVLPFAALAVPAAPVQEPPADRPLRILAFNVHQGFDNEGTVNPDLFAEVLREADADVVALQESDTTRFTSANLDVTRHLARRLGYHHHAGPPTREQSVGVSLLSRFPIVEASWHKLPSPTDNRLHLEARLDVHGRDLWVHVVHLGLPAPDRLLQVDALLAQAAKNSPRILAGDFNSCPAGRCPGFEGPPDDVHRRVLDAGHVDGWAALGRDPDDPAARTYDAFDPVERIDYVFATPDLTFTRYETVKTEKARAASDHLPVLAEVRMG